MDHFTFRKGELHAEDVPVWAIAEQFGTPCYVYSRATLERHARVFREALDAVPNKLIAFAGIWTGLAIFAYSLLQREAPPPPAPP